MTSTTQSGEISGTQRNKIYLVFIWLIRLVLLASAVWETQTGNRWHIFFINLFAFVLTFLPFGIRVALKISFPRAFETGIYLSILLMVTIEKFMEGNLVFVFLGFLLGIVGYILMYVMYYHKRAGAVNFMVVLFAFCFSVSLGAVWEVFHYFMTDILKVQLEGFSHDYSPLGLVLIMLGAGTASVIGYIYLKFSRKYFIQKVISNFIKRNPNLNLDDESPEYIKKLIEKGESETLEFKTTLRMNLYTKVKDKRIEQAVTKTLVAFLNSQGGTLLVGVSDKGEIEGIEKDKFTNNDGFHRHFSNLITRQIGNEYLPFISSKIIRMDDKQIMKVTCSQSNREVFLKADQNEEFYVRTGPTSQKLEGSELISYVSKKFK